MNQSIHLRGSCHLATPRGFARGGPASMPPARAVSNSTLVRLAVIGLVVLAAGTARAGEGKMNAWGFYVAPTTHAFVEGSRWDVAATSTTLDEGAYYTRFFGPRWSVRLEVRVESRHLDSFVSDDLAPGSLIWVRLSEQLVEVPLVFESGQRVMIDDHELRVSVGVGASVSRVADQRLVGPSGDLKTLVAGEYNKFGWLMDGGVTLAVRDDFGVFARFRYQRDETIFGEKEGADVTRRYEAYGLAVGTEFGF